jgi:hypothetical protein
MQMRIVRESYIFYLVHRHTGTTLLLEKKPMAPPAHPEVPNSLAPVRGQQKLNPKRIIPIQDDIFNAIRRRSNTGQLLRRLTRGPMETHHRW